MLVSHMCLYVCVFVSHPGYCPENFIKARVKGLGEVFECFKSKKR